MLKKKKKIEKLNNNLDKINYILSKNNVIELVELLGNSKKLILRNFFAGISKGIGIGIGVTILSAILLIVLKEIVKLNIPIIGQYIADIAEIVENNK